MLPAEHSPRQSSMRRGSAEMASGRGAHGDVIAFENVPTGARFIALATYRRSGMGVATPVWFARGDASLYVVTHATSGKVKRLRNDASAAVAPCRSQGAPTGAAAPASARVLEGAEAMRAAKAISRRYFRVPIRLI